MERVGGGGVILVVSWGEEVRGGYVVCMVGIYVLAQWCGVGTWSLAVV